jgi:hypothetical protein
MQALKKAMSLPTDTFGISGFWFTEFESIHNVHFDTYIKELKHTVTRMDVTTDGFWIADRIYWTL